VQKMDLTVNDGEVKIEGIEGRALEIELEIQPGDAQEYGIKVCCSPDGREQTSIFYDAEEKKFRIDLTKTSLDENLMKGVYEDPGLLQEADFKLDSGESLNLHIFIDHSVLEVFVNNRLCLTHRIYPILEDSKGVAIFSRDGRIEVPVINSWKMHPANPF